MPRKRSIAEIVALEGVAVDSTSHKSDAREIPSASPDTAPSVLQPSQMRGEDKEAYEQGKWDGIERRTASENSEEYRKALVKRAQRKSDWQELIFHYGTLCGLILVAALWGLMIIFNTGVLHNG